MASEEFVEADALEDTVVFRFKFAINSSVASKRPADSDVVRRTGLSDVLLPLPTLVWPLVSLSLRDIPPDGP